MNPITGIINYVRSSRAELEKVSWPSRQDTFRYTGLVVGVSVVIAVFFAALDFGLNKTVEAVLSRRAPAAAAPVAPATPVTPDLQMEPVSAEAVTPSGQPANVKVETVPVNPNTKK